MTGPFSSPAALKLSLYGVVLSAGTKKRSATSERVFVAEALRGGGRDSRDGTRGVVVGGVEAGPQWPA